MPVKIDMAALTTCDPGCESSLRHHQYVAPGLGPSDGCPVITQHLKRQRRRKEEKEKRRRVHIICIL